MYCFSSSVIKGWFSGTLLLKYSQGISHIIPKKPIRTNVAFHPKARYSKTMIGAETTEPKLAPAPKIPCAIARSFGGNHSALLFVAPGQFPDSKKPRKRRKILKLIIDMANECNAMDKLHPSMEIVIPKQVPIASIILPVAV